MADSFIEVPITTDKHTLVDNAKARLSEQWTDWAPNDGDLEVIILEETGGMAADVAENAARVPAAIFREYGTKLVGVSYSAGSPAVSTVRVDVVDAAGYLIPEGTELDVDGYAFTIDVDVTIPAGSGFASGISITAAENGTAYNDLTGTITSLITSIAAVTGVTLEATTGGGTDEEDDDDYQGRLSRDLELQARTLITGRDYELMAINRLTLLGASDPRVKADQDIDTKTVVVTMMDVGEPVSDAAKTVILEEYDSYRVSNWDVSIVDPTYTVVDVDYVIHPYPGFNREDLLARIDAMLADWLSPASFGRPKNFGDQTTSAPWYGDSVVRMNKIIDLIGDVEGVDYVVSVAIAGADVDGNLTLAGAVGLPEPGTIAGALDTDP